MQNPLQIKTTKSCTFWSDSTGSTSVHH